MSIEQNASPSLSPEAIAQLVEGHRAFLAFLERRVESKAAAEDILQAAFTRGLERGAGVPEEKVYSNIAEHGNTSSASIPIAIDECIQSGKIKEGDLVLLSAFGGGVTWGGTLIRF